MLLNRHSSPLLVIMPVYAMILGWASKPRWAYDNPIIELWMVAYYSSVFLGLIFVVMGYKTTFMAKPCPQERTDYIGKALFYIRIFAIPAILFWFITEAWNLSAELFVLLFLGGLIMALMFDFEPCNCDKHE